MTQEPRRGGGYNVRAGVPTETAVHPRSSPPACRLQPCPEAVSTQETKGAVLCPPCPGAWEGWARGSSWGWGLEELLGTRLKNSQKQAQCPQAGAPPRLSSYPLASGFRSGASGAADSTGEPPHGLEALLPSYRGLWRQKRHMPLGQVDPAPVP